MGVAIEVNQGSSKMVRLVGGKLVLEESQNNIYRVPKTGMECDWTITGYQLPFKMKNNPKWVAEGAAEYVEKTRLEFTIEGGPADGVLFRVLFGFALGPRAGLGKFCRKLGVELGTNFDLDNLVGIRGHSYAGPATDATGAVLLDDQGKPAYVGIPLDDRFRFVSAPEKPYFIDLSDVDTSTPAPRNGNGPSPEPPASTPDDDESLWN
jgi:hypothetical protein